MPDISVNDVIISQAEIAREVQNQSAASHREAWEAAARALAIRELLLQRARALAIPVEPHIEDGARETAEEALIRGLLDRDIKVPSADEDICLRYHRVNAARFHSPDLFEPRHILFKARVDDQAGYARAIARAEAAIATLRDAPGRFDELARSLSDCPSAAEGGRLGQVSRGETTPEFEAALLTLQPGDLCREPVLTRYGVHVLRLERMEPGRQLPFGQVKELIAAFLEESAWRTAVSQYVSLLAGQARIAGIELRAASSPLVQ